MKKMGLLAAAAAMVATPAFAEGFYANGGYQRFSEDVDIGGGESESLDYGAFVGRAGYQLANGFGVEGEFMFGADDYELSESGITLTYGIDNAFGGFATYTLPLGTNFELLGRLGYTTLSYKAELSDGTDTVDLFEFTGEDDSVGAISGGIAGQFMITPMFGVRGDVTRYEADDGGVTTVAGSLVVKFN